MSMNLEMVKPISNAEFMLLQILDQEGALSGYEIKRLVDARGYRKWAGIGTTSIYAGLTKLEKKEYLRARIDMEKKGRGPLPKKFTLLAKGKKILKKEVMLVLSSIQYRGERFDLGLSASSVLKKNELIKALQQRRALLEKALDHLRTDVFEPQGGMNLPKTAVWLFQHSFKKIAVEIDFADMIMNEITETSIHD